MIQAYRERTFWSGMHRKLTGRDQTSPSCMDAHRKRSDRSEVHKAHIERLIRKGMHGSSRRETRLVRGAWELAKKDQDRSRVHGSSQR